MSATTSRIEEAKKPLPDTTRAQCGEEFMDLEKKLRGYITDLTKRCQEQQAKLEELQNKNAELTLHNCELKTLIKPYINEILQSITKQLIVEISKTPEAKKALIEKLNNEKEAPPHEVAEMIRSIWKESDHLESSAPLNKQVADLQKALAALGITSGDGDYKVTVTEGSSIPYRTIAETCGSLMAHVVLGGSSLSFQLALWLCKRFAPLIAVGIVSSIYFDTTWAATLFFLLG